MKKTKLIILVGKDGRPSMKNTYTKMTSDSDLMVRRRIVGRRTGRIKEYFRKYTNNSVDNLQKVNIADADFKGKVVIRWGNRIEIDLNGSITYNKAEAIANATDKKLSRKILAEAGVRVPRAVTPDDRDINYPVIARPRIHAKGKNFVILKTFADLIRHYSANEQNGWYYSEFVDKVSEYRIHCAHGRILNYLRKPNPGNGQIAWNRALNGEAFDNVKWSEYDKAVTVEALKAVEALGLDFAGVDVIVDAEGKAYILELNTSPTLNSSEYSMSRYAKYFDWLLKTGERREHFPISDFKKASNYAWHEYHFEDREPNKK